MRAFIAVPISEEMKQAIDPFRKALQLDGVKPVERENLHITLFFLGEIDDRRKRDVSDMLENLPLKKFELHLRGAGVFPNPNFIRVAWVGCEEGSEQLKQIYDALAPTFARWGYKEERFSPHLTVARVKEPQAKESVQRVLQKFEKTDFGFSPVKKVILFRSTLTPKGPAYEEIFTKELG